jgi:hypothetical protein
VAAVLVAAVSFSTGAAADDAALRKEARISETQAQEFALKKAPGTVKSSELEKEKGTLVWSFDIANAKGGGITEVLVSAIDGHVVEAKAETAQQEAAEKAQEAKEKKAKAKSKAGSSTHH